MSEEHGMVGWSVDPGLVAQARGGRQEALDELVGRSLPLVYNIVGRALSGRADVDDVVQETMLRVLRGLPDLREDTAYRSWLAAVTMNQIRRHLQARVSVSESHERALDELAAVADPGADFEDLTLTRLGLSGQRRETVEATRWLDQDDRELLSLWWLVSTGHLTRAELAEALDLQPHHVTVRVGRMKAQLEISRGVVRALTAQPRCPELARGVHLWDGRPSPLWRKRLARHLRECPQCGALGADLVPPERLLVNLALVPLPAGYAAWLLTRLGAGGVHAAAAADAYAWHPGATSGAPSGASHAVGHPGTHGAVAGHGGGHGGYGGGAHGAGAGHGGGHGGGGHGGYPDGYGGGAHGATAGHSAAVGHGGGAGAHGGGGAQVPGPRGGGGSGPVSHRRVARGARLGPLTGKPLLAAAAAAVAVTAVVGGGLLLLGPGDGATGRPGLASSVSGGGTGTPVAQPVVASSPSPSPSISASASASHSASPSAKPTPKPTPTSAPTTAAAAPPSSADAAAVQQVLAVINQARAQQGLAPLQLSSGLNRSSAAHNRTMSAGCGLSHDCPGEAQLGDRETAAGVQWSSAGENIGTGGPVSNDTSGIAGMAVGLTQSMLAEQPPNDGHRRNILSPDFHHIGIAVMRDGSGNVWLTQDFSN